jgi:hypothetical protein
MAGRERVSLTLRGACWYPNLGTHQDSASLGRYAGRQEVSKTAEAQDVGSAAHPRAPPSQGYGDEDFSLRRQAEPLPPVWSTRSQAWAPR